jgi:4-diphosphocytidyl-2-C-methyl-D-erythritol kinase
MATRVRSYSKINLGLAVGPVRADGFHGLATVYQTLALHDLVTVSAKVGAETRITLTANHPGVPCSARGDAEKNTAWKMVVGALERMGVCAEVGIDIDKRLPVQGGMGAGSANAAAALLGLERELGTRLPDEERLRLAAEVGSDVPLFLVGGTVLGTGRGEVVEALPDMAAMAVVVAVPGVGVSTKAAFAELDQRQEVGSRKQEIGRREQRAGEFAEGGDTALPGLRSETWGTQGVGPLTFQQDVGRLEKLSRVLAGVFRGLGEATGPSGVIRRTDDLAENPLLALVRTGIENDFEEVVFSQHPSLRSTKRDLVGGSGDPGTGLSSGNSALYAALSGSGSALFGIYGSQAAAIEAQRRVQAGGTRAILTETLTRQRYWDTMFAE